MKSNYFVFIASSFSVSLSMDDAISVTRLGNVWNFFAANFVSKEAQTFGDFLDRCENHCFFNLNWLCYFLGNF